MARQELWMKHDLMSACDPKMMRFVRLAGAAGYGLYWRLLETLKNQRDHELSEDEVLAIGDSVLLTEDETIRLVTLAVSCRLFDYSEEGKLFQARMKREEGYRRVCEEASKASMASGGRLGGIISGMKRRGATDEEIQEVKKGSGRVASRVEGVELDREREEIDREIDKKKKKSGEASPPAYPPTLDRPDVKTAVSEFQEFRKQKKKPWTKLSIEKTLEKYANNPEGLIKAINHTIEKDWQGLREPEEAPKRGGAPPHRASQNVVNQQASISAVKQILEECGHEVGRD